MIERKITESAKKNSNNNVFCELSVSRHLIINVMLLKIANAQSIQKMSFHNLSYAIFDLLLNIENYNFEMSTRNFSINICNQIVKRNAN